MTGLDVEKDAVLQIAVVCTDGALEQIVEGPEFTIHQPEEVLQGMNEWCVEQHGKSGLTQACRDSTTSLAEAEQAVLEFVQQQAPEPGTAQIAGNSVHVDLAFLRRSMPRLVDHLHYRIVDVSTLGELCRRWFPREHARAPKKKNTHTAMSDIRESITQLQYYRRSIFKKWSGANLP
ncbi:mitochondrial [Micractinium conductrix]|uniref:Mitochondrial n=1 Tax=Micractinium conductrix TaxID=554055 RepID=A0A2P6VEV4_9CHLO|nr:mitochondrial [Micractinium conductrix]|eukprot:PSC72624.1 mitochondrial [Micractinium conductrix]